MPSRSQNLVPEGSDQPRRTGHGKRSTSRHRADGKYHDLLGNAALTLFMMIAVSAVAIAAVTILWPPGQAGSGRDALGPPGSGAAAESATTVGALSLQPSPSLPTATSSSSARTFSSSSRRSQKSTSALSSTVSSVLSAVVGQCLLDVSTDYQTIFKMAACGPGTYLIVARISQHIDSEIAADRACERTKVYYDYYLYTNWDQNPGIPDILFCLRE
jgi:hypothetical protein